jgi:hypothetical protein
LVFNYIIPSGPVGCPVSRITQLETGIVDIITPQ